MNDSLCSHPTHYFVFARKKPINNKNIYTYSVTKKKKPYACSTGAKLKESEHIKWNNV